MCGGSKRYSNPRRARQSLRVAQKLYGSQYAKTVAQRHGVNSRGMKTNGRSSTSNKAKTTNKSTSTKSSKSNKSSNRTNKKTKTTNRSTSTKSSKRNKTKSKKVAGYNKNHPVAKMAQRVKNAPKRTTTPKLRKSQKVQKNEPRKIKTKYMNAQRRSKYGGLLTGDRRKDNKYLKGKTSKPKTVRVNGALMNVSVGTAGKGRNKQKFTKVDTGAETHILRGHHSTKKAGQIVDSSREDRRNRLMYI